MPRQTTLEGSNLPEFVIHRPPSPDAGIGLIGYTCERGGCGKTFFVDLEQELAVGHTAPCPHCFKVSIVGPR